MAVAQSSQEAATSIAAQPKSPLDTAANQEQKVSYLSLPKKGQLVVLCIARMADPLASTSIQVATNVLCTTACGIVDELTILVVHVLPTQVL